MVVLTKGKTIKDTSYEVSLMLSNANVTHVHINNHRTNIDCLLVPVHLIRDVLNQTKR